MGPTRDEIVATWKDNAAAFAAAATEMGYRHESEIGEEDAKAQEDERWLRSRERWGDDPAQPRRYPSLPLNAPLNDPRKG